MANRVRPITVTEADRHEDGKLKVVANLPSAQIAAPA